MCLCLLLTAGGIYQGLPIFCLILICLFTVTFQATNGGVFWVYVAEIVEDAGIGLCVCVLMGLLFLQSVFTNMIIDGIGVQGLFLILGLWQVLTVFVFFFWLKETKGLTKEQKAILYR